MPFSPWTDFWLLVLAQALAFLFLARLRGAAPRELMIRAAISLACGLPLGFAFDLLIGERLAVFHYRIAPNWTFLALNGALSYGLALATASLLPGYLFAAPAGFPRLRPAIVLATATALAVLAAALFRDLLLVRMFAAGWVVVALGETVLLLDRRSGPLCALISGDRKSFVRFWAASAGIGLVYELVNFYFPVWRWALSDTLPRLLVELFVVGFGYFVLFHPLALLWRLGLEQLKGHAADEFVERD